MTPEVKWPKGFTPDPETPYYLVRGQADDHFADQVHSAALVWCKDQDNVDVTEWAEGFADWCAEKAKFRDWPHDYRMPSFSRSWRTFYAEPVDFDGDGCLRDDAGDCTDPEHDHDDES